ncbi:hypothetical protein EYF80_016486 [Liparis tanakae]|uniref:Uncharacterized protein n=1 Tax=Liparis tanakae TaxID=230148 RepID=A0A4Z2I871_9TELE|nr:hypothetical protein EYF80_016486 [Liparis tanakae]
MKLQRLVLGAAYITPLWAGWASHEDQQREPCPTPQACCDDNVREMSAEACQRCPSARRARHLPALSCSCHA